MVRFDWNVSAWMSAAATSRYVRAAVRVPSASLAVIVFTTLALATANANSITLPPPIYQATLFEAGTFITPGTQTITKNLYFQNGGIGNQGGEATGTFSATETMSAQGPVASVSASQSPYEGLLGGASWPTFASLFYSFELVNTGLAQQTPVLLDFAAKGSISDSTSFDKASIAEAAISISYPNGGPTIFSDQLGYLQGQISGSIDQGKSGSLNDSTSFQVPINQVINIQLLAEVILGDGSMTLTATIDPIISIDPNNAPGTTLVLSEGVTQGLGESPGSPGSVPEPGTLGLIGVALAGIAVMRRRRQ